MDFTELFQDGGSHELLLKFQVKWKQGDVLSRDNRNPGKWNKLLGDENLGMVERNWGYRLRKWLHVTLGFLSSDVNIHDFHPLCICLDEAFL